MAFFNPFNFGYPFPQATNAYTGKTTTFLTPPPPTAIPGSFYNVPVNNTPTPPTQWGTTPPNAGLKSVPGIQIPPPTNFTGWGAPTASSPPAKPIATPMTGAEIAALVKSLTAPPPPAPVMQKLITPAAKPAVKAPAAKTPVTAVKTK